MWGSVLLVDRSGEATVKRLLSRLTTDVEHGAVPRHSSPPYIIHEESLDFSPREEPTSFSTPRYCTELLAVFVLKVSVFWMLILDMSELCTFHIELRKAILISIQWHLNQKGLVHFIGKKWLLLWLRGKICLVEEFHVLVVNSQNSCLKLESYRLKLPNTC
jgi:hypothetical protein